MAIDAQTLVQVRTIRTEDNEQGDPVQNAGVPIEITLEELGQWIVDNIEATPAG